MKKRRFPSLQLPQKLTAAILFACVIATSVCTVFFLKTKELAYDAVLLNTRPSTATNVATAESFPIGVDPAREVIIENPAAAVYFQKYLSQEQRSAPRTGWFHHTLALLAQFNWFQNLASPISRILVVDSGERREEVADNFAKILRWDTDEQNTFIALVASTTPKVADGKFFPGHYVVNMNATPQEVAALINRRFNEEVLSRYPEAVSFVVPLADALTIASLLERESYDFEDMRYISGVVWNRLFIDMNLQLDASLQYARANAQSDSWWPVVQPKDKFIDSLYNTYAHKGLPPSPIANPSLEAILAALNPKKTECLFYFHDRDGGFHCTNTYEEHVALLKQIYGRGK